MGQKSGGKKWTNEGKKEGVKKGKKKGKKEEKEGRKVDGWIMELDGWMDGPMDVD